MAQYHKEQYLGAGVPRYVWRTSKDCDVRNGHKQLEGRVFTWSEGAPAKYMSNGKNNNPHEDYQCLPPTARIDLAYGIEKLFRRPYDGDMVTLTMGDMTVVSATPNHPILTENGWLPISALHEGDKLIHLGEQGPLGEYDIENGVPTVGQAFEAFRKAFPMLRSDGHGEQFHGDGAYGDVDIVDAAGLLTVDGKSTIQKRLGKFLFAESDFSSSGLGPQFGHPSIVSLAHSASSIMAGRGQRTTFFGSHAGHAEKIGLGPVTDGNSALNQSFANNRPTHLQAQRNRQFTLSANISLRNGGRIEAQAAPLSTARIVLARSHYAKLSQLAGDIVGTMADSLGDFIKKEPLRQEFLRTIKVVRRDRFVGHVYNLQTRYGWYITGNIIHKNCRCVASPLIDTAYNSKFKVGDVYRKEP
jgi:hypothetical protein